ncbi:InlB B-repeat-containing protein [Acholeplasma laidlawii]|uniref:InlB B-repeat-containing protein n=1 Tax=Acholeplasma laidlawii TaxID=2148 RepID=UPI0021F75AD3|nr:InlB B-repeat-containing protein [Acholeplasma laidlawii]
MKKISIIFTLLMTLVLIACTELTAYKIVFETNGGNDIQAIEFEKSYALAEIEKVVPEKSGYTFNSWYLESDLSEGSKISTDITSSVTLYAKWTITEYTITLHLDGGVIHPDQVSKFTILDEVNLLTPTKEGFKFLGWSISNTEASFVDKVEVGSTEHKSFYAKWENLGEVETFEISFKNHDNAVLQTVEVASGVVPAYTGQTPTKQATLTHTFEFTGWDKAVVAATADTVYVAQFKEVPITSGTTFNPALLNSIFGLDVYALIPEIVTSDYEVIDNSNDLFNDVYIDVFDWTESDLMAYDALLENLLTYDALEDAYILGDLFIYLYADDEIVPGSIIYGIGIYQYLEDETPVDPVDPVGAPFDKDELNGIFGFDIYALLPAITSNNVIITDLSNETNFEVYVDIFTWSEADADAYDALLSGSLAYDATEDAYKLGDYFAYIFIDEETYPGLTVFGLAIYGDKAGTTPVDPVEPEIGEYYSFNVQETTSTLDGSYKNNIDVTLNFANNTNKVIVKASHIANITQAAPGGLSLGKIFAANVSGNANPTVYLEIDALGNLIDTMSFEIQARTGFSPNLAGAKLQVFNNGVWTDLAGGNFYSQITSSKTLITISGINASKFRLLFQGTGATSNGGQFMIFNVNLLTGNAPAPVYELWSDVVTDLEAKFDDLDFNTYMPDFADLTNLKVTKVSDKSFKVVGSTTLDVNNLYTSYINLILNKSFEKDNDLSLVRGHDVYVYVVNDDLAYAMYIIKGTESLEVYIYQFDAVMDDVVLETLSKRQSINEYEVSQFGMSGLPSTGTYDVLVVPVEIQNVPFEASYKTKLDKVFNGTSLDTGWESVASYYYKSSFGLLDLNFDILDKHITSNVKSYYEGKGQDGDQHAILDALTALDSTIDFSKYDSNNDGVIDSIIFIYSTDYNYDVNPWWAWVYVSNPDIVGSVSELDGKNFEYYFWASYDFMNDALPGNSDLILNSETYIHELGHLMGIVDFYPYEGNNQYGPMGGFDMMDANAGDHGPFNKLVFGWLQPLIAQKGTYQVTLDSYSTDTDGLNNTLLIPFNTSDLNDGNAFDEYLLVMFYTPNGLYSAHSGLEYIPSNAGIVVYHIDARLTSNPVFWGEYFINDNEGSSSFINQILEADKNNSIPGNGSIKQSDLLTSGTLNLNTYSWNQGGKINVSLTVASLFNNSSENVTLTVSVA